MVQYVHRQRLRKTTAQWVQCSFQLHRINTAGTSTDLDCSHGRPEGKNGTKAKQELTVLSDPVYTQGQPEEGHGTMGSVVLPILYDHPDRSLYWFLRHSPPRVKLTLCLPLPAQVLQHGQHTLTIFLCGGVSSWGLSPVICLMHNTWTEDSTLKGRMLQQTEINIRNAFLAHYLLRQW